MTLLPTVEIIRVGRSRYQIFIDGDLHVDGLMDVATARRIAERARAEIATTASMQRLHEEQVMNVVLRGRN
jgi:hypothetical protein